MLWQGKRQADISRDLGWDRSRVSKILGGTQPYSRKDVFAVATWLGIEPYELLMPPAEAMGLRSLRKAAAQIVAEAPPPPPFEGAAKAPAAPRRRSRL